MCRSIKTLRGAEPPATDADVQAAALQFVRKISGYRAPSQANREVFDRATLEVATSAQRLLEGLAPVRSSARRPTTGNAAQRRENPRRARQEAARRTA